VNLVEAMARSQSHDEIVHCEAAQDEIDGLLAEAEGYVDLTHQYGHWDVWGTDDDGVPWRLAISLEKPTRADRLAALAAAVGDDGTGDLGVIIDHADPDDTLEELVAVVREAREDAAVEAARERQPEPRATCCDGECGGIRSRCEEWGERDAEERE
jgi:hypothetical protein